MGSLGCLEALLRPCWVSLGPAGALLGPSWGTLWALLGLSWALLGHSWGCLGGSRGMLRTLLGSCSLLGLSWPPSEARPCNFGLPFWSHFGHILDSILGFILGVVLETLFEGFFAPKSFPGEGKERPRDTTKWDFCCYLQCFWHVVGFAAVRFLASSWWPVGANLAS